MICREDFMRKFFRLFHGGPARALALSIPVFLVLAAALSAGDAPRAAGRGDAFGREQKEAVVRRVAGEFRARYVFVDVAEKMAAQVEGNFAKGAYDAISGLAPLAARLQDDLRSVSHDLHVKVLPGIVPDFDADAEMLRRENYGFTAVEVLPGNIGYLDFFQFYSVKDAGPTAIAAMNFLAGCDALIIDLRANGGGHTGMRSLICSYLFAEPACLMEFRSRQGTIQDWTLPYVPGPSLAKIPVYILISRLTFSCAEDFSFCLQNLGRATVIGENTRGGAHDAQMLAFPAENVSLQIPFNEALDPRTRKNWEGVGIQPDIPVPADQAFRVAVSEAAKALLAGEKDGGRKLLLEWILQDYSSQLQPLALGRQALRAYEGNYGPYRVVLEGEQLFIHLNERQKRRLLPLAADEFRLVGEDRHDFAMNRVRFSRNGAGRVMELFIHDMDGDRFPVRKRQ
jgi:hypothetical protein